MRPLRRSLPAGLYEISIRVTGQALMLTPSHELNATIIGIVARGQALTGVAIHAFAFLSSHYHMLISVSDSLQLSKFQQFVNGNLAERINRLNDRTGSLWERRFRAIPVAGDRSTQLWRLKYILAHGVKEGLVGRIDEWPGVTSTAWLRRGEPITGVWKSYADETNAKRKKDFVPAPGQFETEYELQLSPLPCFAETPADEWRAQIESLINEIHAEAEEATEFLGGEPLGVDRILATDPFSRVVRGRHKRAPPVLALQLDVRKAMRARLRALEELWRVAAEAAMQLLNGGDIPDGAALPALFWRHLTLGPA